VQLATVEALSRYPVKSMQGESVVSIDVEGGSVVGDRTWALLDASSGRLLSAKRHGALLGATGRLHGDGSCTVTLPDGQTVELGSADADRVLSDWLGFAVRAARATPGAALEYEMTFEPPNDGAEYFAIPAAPGTFLDLAALHLVSTATLHAARAAYPGLDWDVRRFRPNVVVGGVPGAFAEDEWCGSALSAGSAGLRARQPTVRCAMPLRAQPGLDREPHLYDALEAFHRNHLGIYLDAERDGRIELGDAVARVTGP
jgi:uncharacterized protein YcbX